MKIVALVSKKSVYGTEKIYPENNVAKQLAIIAGTTTLTQRTVRAAKAMGIEFALNQEFEGI